MTMKNEGTTTKKEKEVSILTGISMPADWDPNEWDPDAAEIAEIEADEAAQAEIAEGVQDMDDVLTEKEKRKVKRNGKYFSEPARKASLEIDLVFQNKLGKEITTQMRSVEVSKRELRTIIDRYYQVQARRIALGNQIAAIKRGVDTSSELDPLNVLTCDILQWDYDSEKKKETGYKAILDKLTDSHPVTAWLKSVKGIGPVFAAALYAYFDVQKSTYASGFLQYAGLNDNNRPWISSAKAAQIVQGVVGDSKEITDDMLYEISTITQWPYQFLVRKACGAKTEDEITDKRTKTNLINGICIPPYNVKLKKIGYLIGESFIKNQNRGSLYGRIFSERKVEELRRNEAGELASEAQRALSTKNFKDKATREIYESGKLPLGHINARARRYAVKIFLCHVFEEMYRYEYGSYPPVYYVFNMDENGKFDPSGRNARHNKYIQPEVPFTWGEAIPPQFDGAGNYKRY